ncbi:hypothetical protein GCM10017600_64900 [Streptosporangium carneum]|uniref:Uncharacterized protein n=1 Tax=Streptosporangium carneum TaxID=47481 RepID=A0A9W6I8D4_9ACTN|nr:hypothetical protein GCM10017600_64900 [Streptosporangium carneum]
MRERRLGRTVWATAAAALTAGLVVGLGARLLMRAIVLAIGVDSGFSLAGTVAIVVTFAVLAVPAAATATARPALRRGGRWATTAVTGWLAVSTGFGDPKSLLLADEEWLPLLAALTVAFAVLVAAHGWLAQWTARRLALADDSRDSPPVTPRPQQ